MRIKINDDKDLVKSIRKQLKENNGYCPCAVVPSPETKCMCKDFLENIKEGPCHCGLYVKVKE